MISNNLDIWIVENYTKQYENRIKILNELTLVIYTFNESIFS